MQSTLAPLETRLREELQRSPHVSRRNLRCHAEEGRVVLLGTVASYYQKQMAQEAIRRVDGVEEVDNRLQVDWTWDEHSTRPKTNDVGQVS